MKVPQQTKAGSKSTKKECFKNVIQSLYDQVCDEV